MLFCSVITGPYNLGQQKTCKLHIAMCNVVHEAHHIVLIYLYCNIVASLISHKHAHIFVGDLKNES